MTSTTLSSSSESQSDIYLCWPREKLLQLLDSTLKANDILGAETQMFLNHYKSLEMSGGRGEAETRGLRPFMHSESNTTLNDRTSPGSPRPRFTRHHGKSGSRQVEKSLRLKAEDKCEICMKEIEREKEIQRKQLRSVNKVISHLKALIEEATEGELDTKRQEYEFERDVVKGGVGCDNRAVSAEKTVRYFENSLRSKENYMGKLRLKSQALQQQTRKVGLLLKQKEEIGDVLTEIDFQQLQIENTERMEQIEERNKDFFRLKTDGTITVHVLNQHKRKLERIALQSAQVRLDIISRQAMLTRLESEVRLCEAERAQAQEVNRKRRQIVSRYKVPSVIEAVKLKSEINTLSGQVLTWQRKISIAEMEFIAQKKRWNQAQLKAGSTHHPTNPILNC